MEENTKEKSNTITTKKEFLKMYGKAMVVFASYYKFSFGFKGEFNGKSIFVTTGGNAEDIYGLSVCAGEQYSVEQLDIDYGIVRDGETVIAEFI